MDQCKHPFAPSIQSLKMIGHVLWELEAKSPHEKLSPRPLINTDMSIKATLRILHTKLSFLLSHAVKVAQLVNITGDLIHIFSLVLAFSMSFG